MLRLAVWNVLWLLLLEHTGGNFPLWLMPEQVIILPISEKYEKYAEKVLNLLENSEIRALVDNRNETIGRKFVMPK